METTSKGLAIVNAEHINYEYEGMEIRMRTTLKIQAEHLSIRHNLDLYNDSQVEKLVRKGAEKPGEYIGLLITFRCKT